jgi:hypothetical protein
MPNLLAVRHRMRPAEEWQNAMSGEVRITSLFLSRLVAAAALVRCLSVAAEHMTMAPHIRPPCVVRHAVTRPYRHHATAIALQRTGPKLGRACRRCDSFLSVGNRSRPLSVRPAHAAKLMGNPKAAAGPIKLPRPLS